MQQLTLNTLLQGGKYKIEKVLGQGGFGITYLAEQVMLGRKVAIKEFFMKELCERDETTSHVTLSTEGSRDTVNRFREKFLKEARNIARLNHPNIVRIIDVFEENGTAYYVMEYAENGSLADKVKKEGYLSEPVATRYILQVAEALNYIHQRKMNHLDIKPANVMLNENDEAVLIDFGLSKQYDATTGNQTSTTPVGISDGYAPIEQYTGSIEEFSPETDFYALGATFFKLLTGVTPPKASDINEDGVPVNELKTKGVSQTTIDIICKAMEGRKKDRVKDAHIFIDALKIFTPSSKSMAGQVVMTDETTVLIADTHKRYNYEESECGHNSGSDKTTSKMIWLLGIIGVLTILAVLYGVSSLMIISPSAASDSQLSDTASTPLTSASYSNGILKVNGVTYDMVSVTAGTFTMGATSEMKEFYVDEKPTHQVTITNNYYIGKTEVTQALWQAVMGKNSSKFKGANKPVENVSWNDCKNFLSKLNSLTRQNFRLPTEAEWEFAARGGNNSNHYRYSGSSKLGNIAWCEGNSDNTTHNVATKRANELGIYDMSGNVWEWCSDWYTEYASSSQTNPSGASHGSSRVFRGGGYYCDAVFCQSSHRCGYPPDSREDFIGFRLALSE